MILVDDKATPGRMGVGWYHMATDNLAFDGLDELHEMAERLGLRREWLHHHPGIPHYDVPDEKRQAAIARGASLVTTRELVRRCRRSPLRSRRSRA